MNPSREQLETWMRRARDLAEQGRGLVEPNPMVGCLIVKNGQVIGEGFHRRFGDAHAEVEALRNCREDPAGAAAIVSLEPCCHFGKTPPCTQALCDAGIAQVFIGLKDPNPIVSGGGMEQLKQAGMQVHSGILHEELAFQNAGFLKLMRDQQPWVIAKYAMTLDGNIATRSGNSQWISNDECRARVHRLRGQVDGIIVGSNTVAVDNPSLTARPAGARVPTRIVFDSNLKIDLNSKLVSTASEFPTLVFTHRNAPSEKVDSLKRASVEVIPYSGGYAERIGFALQELGQRKLTNVLLEGGSRLMGEFFQANQLDEVWAFVAPRLIGSGIPPLQFSGINTIAEGKELQVKAVEQIGSNIYVRGVLNHELLTQP